jgi:hypothetical protein
MSGQISEWPAVTPGPGDVVIQWALWYPIKLLKLGRGAIQLVAEILVQGHSITKSSGGIL